MQSSFQVGEIVDRYELLEKADALGFGAAYKVRNIEAGRAELMRVLPEDLSSGPTAQRYMREARILQQLVHPSIVAFYRATHIYGRLVLTTELPGGDTLEEALRKGIPDMSVGLRYISDVLGGLICAHQANIVHRCVEPANIHVLSDGSAKIGGFAFARAGNDSRLTAKGLVIGIAGYMSPEQASGATSIDPRSDLYSVGAVLYQVVTGRRVFESDSYFELMKAHVGEALTSPREVRPDLPVKLEKIILRALSKDPGERCQKAADFQASINEVREEIAREST